MLEIEQLMQRLAACGVSMLLKADHERYAENGECWTVVISGSGIPEKFGFVRAEERTLKMCLEVALSRLLEIGEEWVWVKEYIPTNH
ncbi:hypothetical protein AB0L82_23070 [Nocardia sp. NPDC052001]|uniref:hypothetical protein n=1 Tax=Nocardia sp. NPDC052001 TaxID=3154853 RepID=UPI003438018B